MQTELVLSLGELDQLTAAYQSDVDLLENTEFWLSHNDDEIEAALQSSGKRVSDVFSSILGRHTESVFEYLRNHPGCSLMTALHSCGVFCPYC